MKAAIRTFGVFVLSCFFAVAQNASPPVDDAINEGLRREAAKIELRKKLDEAQAAQKRGELAAAAKQYEDCLNLCERIGGTRVELEQRELMAGMITVRLQLADQAQRRGDFTEANTHVERVLKLDSRNKAALDFQAQSEKEKQRNAGMRPSQQTLEKIPEIYKEKVNAGTLVQDGKLLFEAGKLEEAEAKLHQALKLDPGNKAAFYYLELIKEKKYRQETAFQQEWSRQMLVDIAKEWNAPVKREALPTPNPMARTNIVYTSKARQMIFSKLERIRLDLPPYDNINLSTVVNQLGEEAKKRDPDRKGINIILNSFTEPTAQAAPAIDPNTGLAIPTAAPEPVDIGATTIRIVPPLLDVTLGQALDAITKSSDRPIKFSVEDYAIVFSLRTPETPMLFTRWYKVDPNTFLQGMQGVTSQSFGEGSGSSSSGGGGRSGGSRGGSSRSGGGGYGGDSGESEGGSEYVSVRMAGGGYGRSSRSGGGGQFQQQVQTGPIGSRLPGQAGVGIDNLTILTTQDQYNNLVRGYFTAAGVDLAPPKQVFFNDRQGTLMVRATAQDLDIIEQAVQVLNIAPPQLTIEAKFAEVSQDDTRALGFDWFLGNVLMGGGRVGMQGGSAPSYGSPATSGTAANPAGVFPGPAGLDAAGNPILSPAYQFPSGTDGYVSGGLRNSASAPALGTITGILTDPQFRMVIRAMDQRTGVDLLSAPKITTLSSRQAQIKIVDVRYVVTDLDTSQTSSGGGYNPYTTGEIGRASCRERV